MGLRNSILLAALQQYGRQAITFATAMVVARLLSPAEVGVFSISMSVIMLLEALRLMGVPSYYAALPELTTAHLRSCAGIAWVLGAGFAALLWLLSGPAAAFYGNAEVGGSLRILAVAYLLNSIGVTSAMVLWRDLRFDIGLRIGLAAAVLQSATVILLAWSGLGALSLAWAQIVGNVAAAIGNMLGAPRAAWLVPSLRGWREPFRFGGWLTLTSLVGGIGEQAADLISGRVLGLASAALYGRAVGMTGQVRALFHDAAVQAALPAFARAHRHEPRRGMAGAYLRLNAVITGFSWPALAVLAAWAEPVTVLLYGEQWRAAAAVLPTLCLAAAATLATAPYQQALAAAGRVRLLFCCQAATLLLMLVLLLGLARFGLEAMALAQLAAALFGIAASVPALGGAIGLGAGEIARAWWRSAVPTLAVGAVAVLVRLLPLGGAWALARGLALTGAAGLVVWGLAIWLVRHELREQCGEMLERGLARLRPARP